MTVQAEVGGKSQLPFVVNGSPASVISKVSVPLIPQNCCLGERGVEGRKKRKFGEKGQFSCSNVAGGCGTELGSRERVRTCMNMTTVKISRSGMPREGKGKRGGSVLLF
jgi:hypothetical protein